MTRRVRAPGVLAVTGADTGLGRLVRERLAARADVPSVLTVEHPTQRALAGVSTVVHLAVSYDGSAEASERRRRNVDGTRALLEAARGAGVRRVVLMTSSDVYGAVPGSPVPLPDDAPLRADAETGLLGEQVEVERLADHAARTGLAVTVLRPAPLVGGRLGASYDGTQVRQLGAPRLLAVRGVEPLWQLCHVDDLVAAIELAAVGAVTGGVAVGCDGFLPQTTVEQITRKRRVELPASVALGTAERLHRVGLTSASPRELDHLVAPLVVACDRLRAAGWRPAWTNEAALRAHLADRAATGEGRAGAYTAAGATVALLGTAALVRQRRRRRGL